MAAALATTVSGAAGAETATTGSTTKSSSTTKAKPLAAPDKKFLKDASDTAYYEMSLAEKAKHAAKDETAKKAGETINTELQKVWEELATIATAHDEKLPTELTGGDKMKADKLGKMESGKFDKEFLKILSKEAKRMAQAFETATKSAQDPEIKAFAEKWLPTVKKHDADLDKAEAEIAKKK